MNWRAFFKSMVGGLAATAAVRTWPFRVYSFPKEIVLPAQGDVICYGGARGGGKSQMRIIRGMVDPHTMHLLNAQKRFLPADVDYNFKVFAFDHDAYIRRTSAKLEKIIAL